MELRCSICDRFLDNKGPCPDCNDVRETEACRKEMEVAVARYGLTRVLRCLTRHVEQSARNAALHTSPEKPLVEVGNLWRLAMDLNRTSEDSEGVVL